MSSRDQVFVGIGDWWSEARPGTRLAIGATLVAFVGLSGLTPTLFFGVALAWPYAALIAAIGWGRGGFAFTPVALLILFGIAQDVTASAPLGSFGLINLLVYGASAILHQTFDSERSPELVLALPMILLVFAFIVVWAFASLVSGHVIRIEPLAAALISTAALQLILSSIFDLGVRPGVDPGASV
ncbi:MAG: hypothetical protein AAFO63_10125 [Pseudomonadota bacterium]